MTYEEAKEFMQNALRESGIPADMWEACARMFKDIDNKEFIGGRPYSLKAQMREAVNILIPDELSGEGRVDGSH